MNNELIKVTLLSESSVDPCDLISYAAHQCYQAEEPVLGDLIDIEGRLFNPGHHTTLQHCYLTYSIEGMSVGDISSEFHMVSPFYNSDQRSGRFCEKMFLNPDYEKIEKYIKTYWPEVMLKDLKEVLTYVKKGVGLFSNNIERATFVVEKFLKKERPKASDRYIKQMAPKIAKEQLRMFIPVVFPTGFTFTINLSTLVSMYLSVLSPVAKNVLDEMCKKFLAKHPKLNFMFNPKKRNTECPGLRFFYNSNEPTLLFEPELEIINISNNNLVKLVVPDKKDLFPVNLLPFKKKYMDNNFITITSKVKLSLSAMGQDQRHRTIQRSEAAFIQSFYCAPVLRELGLEEEAQKFFLNWSSFYSCFSQDLLTILAPYGAMVSYFKKGDLNAIIHEQGKRTCFSAQEEVYNLARIFREEVKKKDEKRDLFELFGPACFKLGKCVEGDRYCGRNLSHFQFLDFFPIRKV